jgi:hypothetical protein
MTEKPDPIQSLAEAITLHPRFEQAALYYFEDVLTWRRELGLLNRVISSYARNMVVAYVLFLTSANDSGRPEDGATFSRILSLCERRKDCGGRALRSFLLLAQMAGFLKIERGAGDGRVSAYVPTPKLLAETRQHHTAALGCYDILLAQPGFSAACVNEAGFLERLMRTSGKAAVVHDITFAEVHPPLLELLRLDGGYPCAAALTRAHMRDIPLPSTGIISRTYKISASQARNVIRAAEQRGLVEFNASGDLIGAEPLAKMCKNLLARELALYAKYTLGLEDTFMRRLMAVG